MANRFMLPGANSVFQQPTSRPARFWAGFWHGLIMPISFVVSLFNPNVGIYEANNNGNWYNFGFVLGSATTISGPISQA